MLAETQVFCFLVFVGEMKLYLGNGIDAYLLFFSIKLHVYVYNRKKIDTCFYGVLQNRTQS
jgi:hypothetical protein